MFFQLCHRRVVSNACSSCWGSWPTTIRAVRFRLVIKVSDAILHKDCMCISCV